MEKIKILEVLDAYYPCIDGAIGAVQNITKNLNAWAECELAVPSASKKSGYVDDETFTVHRCKSLPAPESYRLGVPCFDRKFVKKIKNTDYDIIHVHSPFAMGRFAVKMAKKKNIPVVATLHTKYSDDFIRSTKSKFLSKIALKYAMYVYNHADYVWTVSHGAAGVLRDYGYKGDITVIYNGTELTRPNNATELVEMVDNKHGLKGQKNVFIFVGRMAMYKNLRLLCDGLKILKDSGTDFKMLFVGGGFDLKELKSYAKEKGIYDDCIFTGEIKDRQTVQAYYLRADMMLFPSTFDMCSVTRFEAAVHEKAVLFIEGSNSAEDIVDGRNGFLCKEDAQSFGEKLIEITKKDGFMREVGERAYQENSRSWTDVADEVLVRYKNLINNYQEKTANEKKTKLKKKRVAKGENV